MISPNPTVEELRQHSKDTFDAIQVGWVKQAPGAGFENALLSILLQQMVAAYEIAAQLAELNGHAEAAHEIMRVWAKAQGFIR